MLSRHATSRQSRKIIKTTRHEQWKTAKRRAKIAKVNLNAMQTQITLEWEQEDAEYSVHKKLEQVFKVVFSPHMLNEIALKTGLQKRKRNMHPMALISVLMMGCVDLTVASLTTMCSYLKKWHQIILKPQSLAAFINKKETSDFIKEIKTIVIKFEMNKVLSRLKDKKNRLNAPLFKRIILQDSTVISLPETMKKLFRGCGGSASEAAMKLDVLFDVNNPSVLKFTCVAGRVSDGNAILSEGIFNYLEKDDIVIRDLGYFNIQQFALISKKEAYFISRLSKSAHIYLNKNDDTPLDLIQCLNDAKKQELDIQIYLGKIERLECRLIGIKVPEEVVEARREQYKRSNGRSKEPSESLTEWNGYTFMITNISKKNLSHNALLKLYKVRWQIELLFKNFKSNLTVDEITGNNKYRILCILYVKIIICWLVTLLCSYAQTFTDKEISFFKFTIWLDKVGDLRQGFARGEIDELLDDLPNYLGLLCKSNKKMKKTTLQELQNQIDKDKCKKST